MSIKTLKNGPQKLLIIDQNPIISQSSPELIFHIVKSWDQASVLLFVICANCINLSTKVCLFFVSLLTLELVFFTQWQSVRWLLFFSCLVWHQGQIPLTILFNAHLLLLLTQAGFTLKNVEIQRVNLEKMGERLF